MLVEPKKTETIIFQNPATGCHGYRVRFVEAKRFHYFLDTCLTFENAVTACDPHRGFLWEEAGDADGTALLVSRGFKVGSVPWKMEHWRPGIARLP